jgi:hypothetical protein
MTIELFTFMEKSRSDLVDRVMDGGYRRLAESTGMSSESLKLLVEQFVEGYNDVLVTGESATMDALFHAVSRLLAVKGTRFSEVFELPLVIREIARSLLAEELEDADSDERFKTFNQHLEELDATSRNVACRFLDVFQEDLNKRIEDHNRYLARTQQELHIDLSNFSIAPHQT